MKSNFQKSLLKGVHEIPFENIAGLDDAAFQKLSDIEKFLIGDTLLTYSLKPEKFDGEVMPTPLEDFPFGPQSVAKSFKGLKKSLVTYVAHFLINYHITNKRLLHPALILQVLSNRNVWDDHIVLLPKVMRKRARWLSEMRPEWQWWNDTLKQDTWENKTNALRFLYFRIMRKFKPAEANELLNASWETEVPDSKKLLLQIIRETYQNSDALLLSNLYNAENSKLKNQIRQLVFITDTSEEFAALKEIVKKSKGNLTTIKNLEFHKEVELKALFLDHKSGTIPTEIFFTHPFEYFAGRPQIMTEFKSYVASLKNNAAFLNDLFINYLYKNDVQSICLLIDIFMEQAENFVLSTSSLRIFSNRNDAFINELLLTMLTACNSVSRWNFYLQIISFGEISLDKKNTSSLITLSTLYLKKSDYSKAIISEFLARACFCIHSSYLGDWTSLCEDLSIQNKELGKMKLDDMIEELITFRQQIEAGLPNGK